MSHCPFCDPAEEYRFLVSGRYMRIIYPKNPILLNHYLIAPIRHTHTIDQLDSEELNEFGELLRLAKSTVPDAIGYNILSNNGTKEVNQQVSHAHMHVFLRLKGDHDPLSAPHDKEIKEFTNQQLQYISQIKRQLSSERL